MTNSAPSATLVHSRLLNREIGDDSLWLENFPTNYITAIECELDMMINERNIYYNYDGQASSIDPYFIGSPNLNPPFDDFGGAIVISKHDPMGFNINQELLSNNNLWQNPFQPPLYGAYNWNHGNMQICCINYNFRPAETTSASNNPLNSSSSMRVYPNPVKDGLNIEYQMKSKDKVTITVYDIMGRKIAEWHPEFTDNTKLCTYKIDAAQLQWPAGNYFIQLSNGKETYKSKLLITK